MCYSAMIWADYRRYVKQFDASLSLREFVELFWWRWPQGEARHQPVKLKMPKAMEAAFTHPDPGNADELEIKRLIDGFNARQAMELERELFAQRTRLANAERVLAVKPTKKASEDQRIAGDKIKQIMGWLTDIRRTELEDRDFRIFPGHYAPVMVMEAGRRVIKPMRYQCRPAGKPALHDAKFPGTYNARRDSLEGYWKALFGHSHGILVVERFYENVDRTGADGRKQNVVLEFNPKAGEPMLVACLWSRWTAPGEPDLLSFAAITDDPPAEIAAAGHDRCIVPIKPGNIDAWLNPDPANLAAQYAILDDRERPYYEHRMAA